MERSLLTKDVETAIAKAYDSGLPANEQRELSEYLAYVRQQLRDPNSLIAPVEDALKSIQDRSKHLQTWKDWFLKPAITNLVVAAISGVVGYLFGKLS